MIPDMETLSNRVLLVGIDGLLIEKAISSGAAPTLNYLTNSSYFAHSRVEGPTISGPSWATILTGATFEEHGILDNSFLDHRLEAFPDLATRAKRISSATTLAAAGWPPLVTPESEGPIIRDVDHLHAFDGETNGYFTVDRQVIDASIDAIREHRPHLSFVYFCEADEVAHKHGVIDQPYFDAIARIDSYLNRLLDLTSELSSKSEPWLVAITTDHGHVDEGGHGGDSDQERATFLIGHGVERNHPNWKSDYSPREISELLLNEL